MICPSPLPWLSLLPLFTSTSTLDPPGTPLVPVVTLDGHELDEIYGGVVRIPSMITELDPSPVSFECNSTNDSFHLMRESGYDSTTSTR